MSHRNINSFRSVKASSLAFEKFQDRFLAKERTLSPKSIKLTSPPRNLTIAEESKTETISAIPFSLVPLGSVHERNIRSIKLKSQDVDCDSESSSQQISGKITDTLHMFKLKKHVNTLGNFSEAFSYLEKKKH